MKKSKLWERESLHCSSDKNWGSTNDVNVDDDNGNITGDIDDDIDDDNIDVDNVFRERGRKLVGNKKANFFF